MCKLVCFIVLNLLGLPEFTLPQATYQCGIRQHGVIHLVGRGSQVEEGHWPWHVAVYQRLKGDDPFEYGCGGTLVNERHVLTAAHCVVRRTARNQLPAIMYEIELHLGQHELSKVTDSVTIRDVSKAHVHPEYAPNRNDIAVLEMRLPVEYSDTVIPICLDQKVDRDLRDLENESGWITGWGKTENGNLSNVLRTASMPVVGYMKCLKDDPVFYGHILNESVFCAGNKNETSPGPGDSGGGMYISDGDRWILIGIISLGKYNELRQEVNFFKYIVFVNVLHHLTWMKEVFAESDPPRKDRRQKRISEQECERFQSLAIKHSNGDCVNNRYRHDVLIYGAVDNLVCNGVLVEENHVITTCSCFRSRKFILEYRNAVVVIDAYGSVDILEMFCHPKYIGYEKPYDIAVIKLKASASLSYTLIPACLATDIQLPMLGSKPRNKTYAEFRFQNNVTILHWCSKSSAFESRCSGTVISVKHVLTAAQCVVNHTIGKPLAADAFQLHFGEYRTVNEYIRYVSEVHVHPEYSVNDIAILVTSWPVRKTQYAAHTSFMNSTDYMYSVTAEVSFNGWSLGKTGIQKNQSVIYFTEGKLRQVCVGKASTCLNIFILDRQECLEIGLRLLPNQYCAGYPNG
ncbi:hypothetical protein RP20_CCG005220 [Aedes albopictus]|nr:hypothetical protein RP20_CCG005220 [Aedes albopictus]